MKAAASIATACLLAFFLTGCSTVNLDREVEIANGVTVKVPSNWVEDMNDYDVGEKMFGSATFAPDKDKTGLSISWSIGDESEHPEQSLRESAAFYNELGSTNWTQELVGERVVSGAECLIYKYSYTTEGEDYTFDTTHYKAFIRKSNFEFDIDAFDDQCLLNSVLDTVKIP